MEGFNAHRQHKNALVEIAALNSTFQISNEILPETKQQAVRSALDDADRELQGLESRMKQLIVQLAELNSKRTRHLACMDTLRCAIATHKYLPSEILADIFISCLDGDGDSEASVVILRDPDNDQPLHFPLRHPWTLGHVCSRWRQIALSETRLWNSISFYGDPQDEPMLEEALLRSGRSQLVLRARECKGFGSFLRRVILPQASRIQKLALELSAELFQELLLLPPGLFDTMERVELSVDPLLCQPRAVEILFNQVSGFQEAPNLRCFVLDSPNLPLVFFPSFPLPLGLCWSLLTVIHITSIDIRIAHKMLSWCNNLCECKLRIDRFNLERRPHEEAAYLAQIDIHQPFQWGSISLPHLRILEVCSISQSESYLYIFMLPLHIPILDEFNFEFWNTPDWALEDLTSLLDWTSRPTLRSQLMYVGPYGADVAELAAPLHFVTSISRCDMYAPFLRRMTYEDCFPRLTSIIGFLNASDMDLFVEMLKKRWLRSDGYPGIQFVMARLEGVNGDSELIAEYSGIIQEVRERMGAFNARIVLV